MTKPASTQQETTGIKLTKKFVEAVSHPALYSDSELKGFRLKVTEAGAKVYLVYGKVRGHRKPIKVTIGKHGQKLPDGSSLTAEKARDRAEIIRGKMLSGINPNLESKKEVAAIQAEEAQNETAKQIRELTLSKVFNEYLNEKQLKVSTKYVYEKDLNKSLKEWLNKPLIDIYEEDISEKHRQLSKEHPGQANHVMRILRAVFNFAINKYKSTDRRATFTNNPVKCLSANRNWNKLKPRQRLIKDHELKPLYESIKFIKHTNTQDYLLVLLLTGLRADEAASLQWSQVDRQSRTLTVLDTKNGSEHTLPLTPFLESLFAARWKKRNGEHIFHGSGKTGYTADYRHQIDKVVEKCRELLNDSDEENYGSAKEFDFSPHDLRRTFTTVAARLLPDYVVKRLTNHIDRADITQSHYVHVAIENLRNPMNVVNDFILSKAGVEGYASNDENR